MLSVPKWAITSTRFELSKLSLNRKLLPFRVSTVSDLYVNFNAANALSPVAYPALPAYHLCLARAHGDLAGLCDEALLVERAGDGGRARQLFS